MRTPSSLMQAALFVSIYLLLGVGSASAQSGNGNDPTTGRIVSIEPKGSLKVKQAKGTDPVDASVLMQVRRGYLLTLSLKGRAKVICADSKVYDLAPGPQGCPCTEPCRPEVCGVRYNGSTIGLTRGPDTDAGLFPAVISPRQTMLRTLRPTIRWSPIAGAKENAVYNVTVYGAGMKVIWTREVVSQTMLKYPDEEPPLTRGQTYKVVVVSEGLSSQQDKSPGLGFTILTAAQEQALAAEEARRKELELPEAQKSFLVSNLYADRRLYAEAIELLEGLYATLKEPAVLVRLGDLYATIGLNREAEKKYLEARRLTLPNDYDGLGLIEKSLAQVYEGLGIIDQAIVRLGEAIKAYRQLGNQAVVNALIEKELELKKNGGGR